LHVGCGVSCRSGKRTSAKASAWVVASSCEAA
jgi:hypothetical protein